MYIATVNSTNDYLRLHPDVITLRTDFQTAGRGQAGNGWESEPGKNLLFSTRLKDLGLDAGEQWLINILVSVALYKTLTHSSTHPLSIHHTAHQKARLFPAGLSSYWSALSTVTS